MAMLRAKLGRDDWIMRGYMVAISIYLLVTLALPLQVILSKSFSTYNFDLSRYELQVSDPEGVWGEPATADFFNPEAW